MEWSSSSVKEILYVSVVGGGAASRRFARTERERDALSLPWCVVSISYLRALVSGGDCWLCITNLFASVL